MVVYWKGSSRNKCSLVDIVRSWLSVIVLFPYLILHGGHITQSAIMYMYVGGEGEKVIHAVDRVTLFFCQNQCFYSAGPATVMAIVVFTNFIVVPFKIELIVPDNKQQ